MDQTTLVAALAFPDRAKEHGRRLVKALDKAGVELVAAFWYLVPGLDVWRLVLATDMYNRSGPKATYSLVQSLLDQQSVGLTLDDVQIVSPDDPLVVTLRARGVGVGGGGTVSFSRPMSEILETIVYRLL